MRPRARSQDTAKHRHTPGCCAAAPQGRVMLDALPLPTMQNGWPSNQRREAESEILSRIDSSRSLWAIPPPFNRASDAFINPQTSAHFPETHAPDLLPALAPAELSRLVLPHIKTAKGRPNANEVFAVASRGTRPEATFNAGGATRSSHRFPVWIPATKHEHSYRGCAPNGLRLFPDPVARKSVARQRRRRLDPLQSRHAQATLEPGWPTRAPKGLVAEVFDMAAPLPIAANNPHFAHLDPPMGTLTKRGTAASTNALLRDHSRPAPVQLG